MPAMLEMTASNGVEVSPQKSCFDYNAGKPHPKAFCPVCGAAKVVFHETCSEICDDLLKWQATQRINHE